jgi:(1->4)-alpha-D-glucan 1-alpha-D-glucosylmutase
VAVAPRLAHELLGNQAERPMPDPDRWADTAIRLPSQIAGARFENVLTLQEVRGAPSLLLRDLLADLPVALLLAD